MEDCASAPRNVVRIRELNDKFRTSLSGGVLVVTQGIHALSVEASVEILKRVVLFDAFTPDNDPYLHHDFGAFDYLGQKIFWKIDCYDHSQTFLSPDPADPRLTMRVLTIMLASEY